MGINPSNCLWGEEFFKTYMEHARRMSYNNDILHQCASISLVGQALRDVYLRIDQQHIGCRMHPFIIQSSGTGKGSVFNMVKKVANEAGMDFQQHGTATTAGIMGTVKRNGEQIDGSLSGSGFIAWNEAQTLLKSADQTHSSDILEVLNMAMDPDGKVVKTLSGGTLRYSSNTSIFCTTYDPEPSGELELIRQGFLPRTLFFYRIMGDDFYDDVNERRDKKVPRGEPNQRYIKELNNDIQKLGNTLKFIEDTVWKHGDVYREGESAYAAAHTHISYFDRGVEEGVSINPSPMMNRLLDKYPYSVRKRARPFKTRMMNKVYRIAACLAATDYDEDHEVYVSREIKQRHVDLAMKICRQSFECILDFIRDYSVGVGDNDLKQIERKVNTIAKNNGGYATIKELMAETYKRKQDIKRGLATLEEMGKVKSVNTPINAADLDDKVKPNIDD